MHLRVDTLCSTKRTCSPTSCSAVSDEHLLARERDAAQMTVARVFPDKEASAEAPRQDAETDESTSRKPLLPPATGSTPPEAISLERGKVRRGSSTELTFTR